MNIIDIRETGIKIMEYPVFADERGDFAEVFREDFFRRRVADCALVQENRSRSRRGVLRGLHCQISRPQGKLVWVGAGRVFDVAVDMRRSSASFGRWFGVELSAENRRQLWIPPGFAHGFYSFEEGSEVCYKCSDYYCPEAECRLLWCDATVGIDWPFAGEPILSDKDRAGECWDKIPKFP